MEHLFHARLEAFCNLVQLAGGLAQIYHCRVKPFTEGFGGLKACRLALGALLLLCRRSFHSAHGGIDDAGALPETAPHAALEEEAVKAPLLRCIEAGPGLADIGVGEVEQPIEGVHRLGLGAFGIDLENPPLEIALRRGKQHLGHFSHGLIAATLPGGGRRCRNVPHRRPAAGKHAFQHSAHAAALPCQIEKQNCS